MRKFVWFGWGTCNVTLEQGCKKVCPIINLMAFPITITLGFYDFFGLYYNLKWLPFILNDKQENTPAENRMRYTDHAVSCHRGVLGSFQGVTQSMSQVLPGATPGQAPQPGLLYPLTRTGVPNPPWKDLGPEFRKEPGTRDWGTPPRTDTHRCNHKITSYTGGNYTASNFLISS